MNSFCDFNNPAQTCPHCGYVAKRLPTYRQCRPVPRATWKPIMIGDMVERGLTAIGVTKERVERLTRTEGKPGGCGCASRQKWLNDVGVRAQVAARKGMLKLRNFYLGET